MIDIVLASYNGEQFIREQILSIQNNSFYHKVSSLIVVDDGSTDNTLGILYHMKRHDHKMEVISNANNRLGSGKNFCRGLSLTTSPYVMLADQDDVWLRHKIQDSFELIRELECDECPVLVFTDLEVVDCQLRSFEKSYFEMKNAPGQWHKSFKNLVQQNVGSGCTMIMNRSLLVKALPIPDSACMHDWWLMLVANKFGKLAFLDRSTMLYRQHSANQIGVRRGRDELANFRLYWNRFYFNVYRGIDQAATFLERYDRLLDADTRIYLEEFSQIEKLGLWKKIQYVAKGKIYRHTLKARFALWLAILIGRPNK